MTTLFISDIHLEAKQRHIAQLFIDFIQHIENIDALYILGDLFEAWVGDDDRSRFNRKIIASLRALSDKGIAIYVMHGNRDFLLGPEFAESAGITLITDPTVISLYGTPTLLLHGDSLCVDDVSYQQYRQKIRDPALQSMLLRKPLFIRKYIAKKLRRQSRKHTANAMGSIMDINQDALKAVIREHQITQIIHGHTHRPSIHNFQLDEQTIRHFVLSDWHQQGNVLVYTSDGQARLRYFDSGSHLS